MTAIDDVADQLAERADALPQSLAYRRIFIDTYRRTTLAVGKAARRRALRGRQLGSASGTSRSPSCTCTHMTLIAMALRCLPSLASRVQRAGRPAAAATRIARHQRARQLRPAAGSAWAVISDVEFTDDVLLDRRRRDHERIDAVLAGRVSAEDDASSAAGKTLLDRLLTPLNRQGSKRFLRRRGRRSGTTPRELQRARLEWCGRLSRSIGRTRRCSAPHASPTCLPPGRCC